MKAAPFLLGALVAPALWAAGDAQTEELPSVTIIGTLTESALVPGTVDRITDEQLERQRPFTVNEALRRATGVNVRDEEGFGLRPNIAIRGLNPTRSTKVTLLEDGLPIAYAPYGDNASYFHPPIERYRSIEVLRGASALAYGPQTIGGVINYLTPEAPDQFLGFLQLDAGSRGYRKANTRIGGKGYLVDFVRKQGEGARENSDHSIDDVNFSMTKVLSGEHSLKLRLNAYREDSTVTYTGLTQAEFERLGARYNPFANDGFGIERRGASLLHRWTPSQNVKLDTSIYYSAFDRDWWRQSSNTTDGQCGTAFTARRLAGLAVDIELCNSVQGRLRNYEFYGVESRMRLENSLGQLTIGGKWHVEEQDRRQVNGASPRARTGILAESNLRDTDAIAIFLAQSFSWGPVSVTPIVRHEQIGAARLNRLGGQSGKARVSKTLPGIGMTWQLGDLATAFAGVHRGFSPPRVEDLIDGAGTATEVDTEESVNFELGLRGGIGGGLRYQVAYFRNDFDNLIAVGSIAGGSTPLSQGEALFSGIEASSTIELPNGLFGNAALTWLDKAEQTTAFRNVASHTLLGVAGNRQPYAPEYTGTAAIGYSTGPLSVQVDVQYVAEQFSDFANTVVGSDDGQQGLIDAHAIWGVTLNYAPNARWTGYLTAKNVTDKVYIVDRTRGIQVGIPRLLHAGVRVNF